MIKNDVLEVCTNKVCQLKDFIDILHKNMILKIVLKTSWMI